MYSKIKSFLFIGTIKSSVWEWIKMVALGTIVLIVGSKIYIPLHPVPLTLQNVAVLWIGLTLSPLCVVASMVGWIGLGFIGLPVFSDISTFAPAVFFGPAGGYIIGFFFAALLMAFLREKLQVFHLFSSVIFSMLGTFVIFFFGAMQLYFFVGKNWTAVWEIGVIPFLINDIIKVLLVCASLELKRNIFDRRLP